MVILLKDIIETPLEDTFESFGIERSPLVIK